jgi:hypothetical protein
VAAEEDQRRGGIVTEDSPGSLPDFEIEAATVEEFLRLLKEREGRVPPEGSRGPLRRAVFLTRILDQRSSRFGYPLVTRHVVAAFVYGRDTVCCRTITSNAVELPELASKTEERQRAVYEEMRAEIVRGLEESDLAGEVPLYEGCLRRASEPGGEE